MMVCLAAVDDSEDCVRETHLIEMPYEDMPGEVGLDFQQMMTLIVMLFVIILGFAVPYYGTQMLLALVTWTPK